MVVGFYAQGLGLPICPGQEASDPFNRLRLEKHRISPLHRRAVISPAVALAQEIGRLGHFGVGLAGQFAALPLACRQGLVSGRGHVEQHLAQVGTALGAAHMLVDDLAPARAHGAADELVHAVWRTDAFGVGDVVHGGGDVLDHHLVVEGDADFQVVDRLVGGKWPFVGHFKIEGLDIGQLGFDVPQAVFSVKALVHHGARM